MLSPSLAIHCHMQWLWYIDSKIKCFWNERIKNQVESNQRPTPILINPWPVCLFLAHSRLFQLLWAPLPFRYARVENNGMLSRAFLDAPWFICATLGGWTGSLINVHAFLGSAFFSVWEDIFNRKKSRARRPSLDSGLSVSVDLSCSSVQNILARATQ